MTAVLWHIELSHYNEKARWALDYKGVPYELRAPMPGFHGARALYETRGKQRRLPVLELDGRTIGDSTAIIAALEEHTPDPPLYPADPAERARALELEDYFDEELGPEIRRFGWHHLLADPDAAAEALFRGESPLRARVLRTTFGVARACRSGRTTGSTPTATRSRGARSWPSMDRLEAELDGREYLAGDTFSVADLTAAALFTPLIRPPERPFMPDAVAPAPGGVRRRADGPPRRAVGPGHVPAPPRRVRRRAGLELQPLQHVLELRRAVVAHPGHAPRPVRVGRARRRPRRRSPAASCRCCAAGRRRRATSPRPRRAAVRRGGCGRRPRGRRRTSRSRTTWAMARRPPRRSSSGEMSDRKRPMPRWFSDADGGGDGHPPQREPGGPAAHGPLDQTSREVLPPRRARWAGELWATACENAYTGATVAS